MSVVVGVVGFQVFTVFAQRLGGVENNPCTVGELAQLVAQAGFLDGAAQRHVQGVGIRLAAFLLVLVADGLEFGGTQVHGRGGLGMVNTGGGNHETLARVDGIILPASRNLPDIGADENVLVRMLQFVAEVIDLVAERVAQADAVGIDHLVGIVVHFEEGVLQVAGARRAGHHAGIVVDFLENQRGRNRYGDGNGGFFVKNLDAGHRADVVARLPAGGTLCRDGNVVDARDQPEGIRRAGGPVKLKRLFRSDIGHSDVIGIRARDIFAQGTFVKDGFPADIRNTAFFCAGKQERRQATYGNDGRDSHIFSLISKPKYIGLFSSV